MAYARYLFDTSLLQTPEKSLKDSSTRQLKDKLGLDKENIGDWSTQSFWSLVRQEFTPSDEQNSFTLLICSGFLRDRSYQGETPAMYQFWVSRTLILSRYIVQSLFSAVPGEISANKCTNNPETCSSLNCLCPKNATIATEYHGEKDKRRNIPFHQLKELSTLLKAEPKS